MAIAYFKAYFSYLESIEPLTDEERGRLFTALLIFASTGEVVPMVGNERFVFASMKAQILRDKEVYDKKCTKNKANISIRWNTNEYERIRTYTNDTKEKVKEKVKVKDKDNIKEKILKKENPIDQALLDFEKMRNAIKKPLTDRAKKMIENKLNEYAEPYQDKDRYKIECLEQSIVNNWMSVYPLKDFKDSEDFSEDDKVFEAYLAYQREDPERSFSETLTLSEFAERWREENAASS